MFVDDNYLSTLSTDFCEPSYISLTQEYQHIKSTIVGALFYGRNSDCTWFLSTAGENFIVVYFSLLYIEFEKEYLYIGFGHNMTSSSEVMRLTGRGAPSRVTFNSSTLWMRFTSNWKTSWLGYYIFFQSSESFGMSLNKFRLNLSFKNQNLL